MRVERYRASSCTSMAATGRRRNVDEERCQSGSSGTLQEKRAASCFNALEYSRTARRRRLQGGSMSPKTDTRKSAKGFTDEERAAMKERVQELKAEARRGPRAKQADGESDVLAKIAEMPKPDRAMAERLHAIIKASAPALLPRTWYGMPAYAKDDHVVCFFQSAHKFKARYATFGFSDKANLDEGTVWPTAAAEARIVALVKKAVS